MTETTPNQLLAAITNTESAAFRTGQVVRRLMAEHPHLTTRRVICSVYSAVDGYDDKPYHPKLEVSADGLDSARAWALALKADLQFSTKDAKTFVYEAGRCDSEIDGVLIEVRGTRTLPDEEAAAWRAKQGQAADGGEG